MSTTTTVTDLPRTLRGTQARPENCQGCRRLAFRHSSLAASWTTRHLDHAPVRAEMLF